MTEWKTSHTKIIHPLIKGKKESYVEGNFFDIKIVLMGFPIMSTTKENYKDYKRKYLSNKMLVPKHITSSVNTFKYKMSIYYLHMSTLSYLVVHMNYCIVAPVFYHN